MPKTARTRSSACYAPEKTSHQQTMLPAAPAVQRTDEPYQITGVRLIQINLNHCSAAQDLLYQEIAELNIDIAIIAEPYHVPANGAWIADPNKWSAIYACGNYPIQEIINQSTAGMVAAKINGMYIFSCYAPPRLTNQEFTRLLEDTVHEARGKHPAIIAGDFNAWATEWGSKSTNTRGTILIEVFARLDVILANSGNTSTFRKNGSESVIDLTFASGSLMRNINWRVSERYTFSDHQALLYEGFLHNPNKSKPRITPTQGWSTKWFDKETFRYILESAELPQQPANSMASWSTNLLKQACSASLPKKRRSWANQMSFGGTSASRNVEPTALEQDDSTTEEAAAQTARI